VADTLVEPDPQVAERLDEHLARYPHCAERIYRRLLVVLHTRGIVAIDAVYAQAQARAELPAAAAISDPNQPTGPQLTREERERVEQITRDYVSRYLTIDEVDDLVNLVIKREEVQHLEAIANQPNVEFRTLAEKVRAFCDLPLGESRLPPAEVMGTRVALIRNLVSDQLEFIGIAKQHLRIRDFGDIVRRTIGSDHRMGRVGGKAGGMLLAHRIVADALPAGVRWPLRFPDTYYVRSDLIDEFLELNRLGEYRNQKYKDIDEIRNEYPLIKGVFRNSDFPIEIVQKLRNLLAEIGTAPLIVRSSSLLEDRFGTAFCGKYASIFVANQGSLEARLRVLLGAIAEVYASALAPDPIQYRRAHHLIDYDEELGVMIQRVVGRRFGRYFLPTFAGVAFSRNEHRWSPRIRREDGLARLVVGLGTRAVDRVGAEYPRMVALGTPTLRPESNVEVIRQQAQRGLDVIDLERNRLESVNLPTLLAATPERFPLLDLLISVYQDGGLYPPTTSIIDAPAHCLTITFDKLLSATDFADYLRRVLSVLEQAYGVPVDIEFVCDGRDFYLLQCRPQTALVAGAAVSIPAGIPAERIVFSAARYVRTGTIDDIEYIIRVDPTAYAMLSSPEQATGAARVIGRLNRKLADRRFVLIGPGRWGSNDLRLGVRVTYADINNTKMLIEVARPVGGYLPEVSFGTHFFQDLVESNISYLPLYPEEPGNVFNERILHAPQNALADLLPDDAAYAPVVHVIYVPAVYGGRKLRVVMDGETDRALAYLV
jgi:hypothetical protein